MAEGEGERDKKKKKQQGGDENCCSIIPTAPAKCSHKLRIIRTPYNIFYAEKV